MSLSTSLKTTAINLINKYGNTGTLTEVTPGAYTPSTGKQVDITLDVDVKYFKEQYSSYDIEKGLYGINDFKATIVYDKEIQKSWLLNGSEIINVIITQAQDLSIVQELQCRR